MKLKQCFVIRRNFSCLNLVSEEANEIEIIENQSEKFFEYIQSENNQLNLPDV